MKPERRFCTCCGREMLHDVFKNIWGRKGRTGHAERLVFGVLTLGLSEASSERQARCQGCQHTTTL